MNIGEEIKSLEWMIKEHQARIKVLRNECDHPAEKRTYKYESDIGNWSKSDDTYWVNIECQCGKKWSLDSEMHSWAYRAPLQAILPKV